jgi:hypothetical protein
MSQERKCPQLAARLAASVFPLDAGSGKTLIFNLRQLSTTERIAATFGPACGLPMCNQFFRPRALHHRLRLSNRCVGQTLTVNLEVHHQEFRSHSGHDSEENLITLCSTCHASAHCQMDDPFKRPIR